MRHRFAGMFLLASFAFAGDGMLDSNNVHAADPDTEAAGGRILPPVPALSQSSRAQAQPIIRKPLNASDAQVEISAALELSSRRSYDRFKDIANAVNVDAMAAVLEALKQPQYADARQRVAEVLLSRYAKVDLPAAMAYANGIKDSGDRNQAVRAVLEGWAEVDAASAAVWIRKLPAGWLRDNATSDVAAIMAHEDPEAALKLVFSPGGHAKYLGSEFDEIFAAWARKDPAAAAARAAQLPRSEARNMAFNAIARVWARRDVEKALKWAQSLSDEDEKSPALSAVISRLAQSDPQRAAALVLTLPQGTTQALAAGRVVSQWGAIDTPAALAWVQQLPNGLTKQEAFGILITRWVERDPTAAFDWMQTLPRSQAVNQLLNHIVRSAALTNPRALTDYAESLPEGAFRDNLMAALVPALVNADPQFAVSWADAIADEKQRLSQLENVARQWLRADQASAADWIATSKLPDDLKRRLLPGGRN